MNLVLASHEWERLPLATRLAVKHPKGLVLLTMPEDVNTYNCYVLLGYEPKTSRVNRKHARCVPRGRGGRL
jgi:hypothetical protein